MYIYEEVKDNIVRLLHGSAFISAGNHENKIAHDQPAFLECEEKRNKTVIVELHYQLIIYIMNKITIR